MERAYSNFVCPSCMICTPDPSDSKVVFRVSSKDTLHFASLCRNFRHMGIQLYVSQQLNTQI